MLVLNRRLHERIRIDLPGGQHIWLMIAEINRGNVRVGLNGPENVRFWREEVAPEKTPCERIR